jgi:succinate-acetate transporter protein
MATVPHTEAAAPAIAIPAEEPVAVAGFSGGNPQILGLPIFAVGSLALAFSLVGYVPATAAGIVVPVIFAATGVGLVISTLWAVALGQTMVASVFGLFAGFWLSFAILLLGLFHNWFLIPAGAANKSVALFLISWSIVFFALTLATVRLPVSYTAVIALVVLALVLRTIGVLNADTSLDKAAGYVVFVFAALGIYLFLGAASAATGGKSYPPGPPIVR